MDKYELYDKTDPASIESYAQKLIGHTFNEIKEWHLPVSMKEDAFTYGNKARKGGLGNFIEEQFFGYKANNDANADFSEAGVELKVTPYEKKSNKLTAGERLVLTMISYDDPVEPDLFTSHLWQKCKLILLIYYLRDKTVKSNMDYRIDYVKLFSPPANDLKIIEHDYQIIIEKIAAGKANELSEADTMYLGACTKGSTALKSTVPQHYYAPDVTARRRAFCFKNSYMTQVLNSYIVSGNDTYESIIKGRLISSFEDYVIDRINGFRGWSVNQLCDEFEIDSNARNAKNLGAILAYRILGIKSNNAEEFVKANIVVKTIRIEKSGTIKESMSFPAFQFKELIKENWEDSAFASYLSETRFLFVVYRYNESSELILKGCQFWHIPYDDLEGNVRAVWEETKRVIREGLQIKKIGNRTTSNLPKASNNEVCHVRPHARDSKDTFELPDGRHYPKQCFWLNNSYILSQLKEELIV